MAAMLCDIPGESKAAFCLPVAKRLQAGGLLPEQTSMSFKLFTFLLEDTEG